MRSLNIVHDTRDTFHGRSVFQAWKKEDFWWSKTTCNQEYNFPTLERSKYGQESDGNSLNTHINLKDPTICLDLNWSPDGTSVVTVSNDFGIRQYLVPEEPGAVLVPFKRFFRAQSIVSSCVHPYYSMFGGNEGVNVMLVSSKDLPIQLFSLSPHATEHAPLFSYSVVNPENENYDKVFALSFFLKSGFLTGSSRNKVSAYDLNRRIPLWTSSVPSRVSGHRSIVSCFDQGFDSIVSSFRYGATYKNDIFGIDTRLKSVMPQADKNSLGVKDGNCGIVQLIQSVNQHFLYVVKRNSESIDILDIRQGLSKINELALPFQLDSQKFKASLDSTNGLLIGTSDGRVLQWSSDVIEFGGLVRTTNPEQGTHLAPDAEYTEYSLEKPKNRINIVASNPSNPDFIVSSYSPNKFEENGEALSGIITFSLQDQSTPTRSTE
ncbi:LAFA_0F14796g1_1 [Lachancea sp. 'fantastica']|nr:LAFA_0F14796g1_1 [Lachancea sp. 'fantastica']